MVKFSIIIPTWKNIEYLDLAYNSILKNSAVEHEIVVFFNEFDEQAGKWLSDKHVIFDSSDTNIGVCGAVNRAVRKAGTDYVCFVNDDMYVLPGWDTALAGHLGSAGKLWLSGTAVEAGRATACYIGGRDYGDSPANFREKELLGGFAGLKRPYNVSSTWTPTPLRVL